METYRLRLGLGTIIASTVIQDKLANKRSLLEDITIDLVRKTLILTLNAGMKIKNVIIKKPLF